MKITCSFKLLLKISLNMLFRNVLQREKRSERTVVFCSPPYAALVCCPVVAHVTGHTFVVLTDPKVLACAIDKVGVKETGNTKYLQVDIKYACECSFHTILNRIHLSALGSLGFTASA